jgi:hypothetical protein
MFIDSTPKVRVIAAFAFFLDLLMKARATLHVSSFKGKEILVIDVSGAGMGNKHDSCDDLTSNKVSLTIFAQQLDARLS